MIFFPVRQETIIMGSPCEEFAERMLHQVFIIDPDRPEKPPAGFVFNGMQQGPDWHISLTAGKNNFLPIAHIRMEPTNANCLISVKYRLFSSTKRALVLWSMLSLFIGLFFILLHAQWMYGVICLSIGLVNYILVRANFSIHVRKTSEALRNHLFNNNQ